MGRRHGLCHRAACGELGCEVGSDGGGGGVVEYERGGQRQFDAAVEQIGVLHSSQGIQAA